jgi:predicted amino acid-binding ACT domain protein
MIAIADISTSGHDFKKIKHDLEEEGNTLNINLLIQRKEIFDRMHRV